MAQIHLKNVRIDGLQLRALNLSIRVILNFFRAAFLNHALADAQVRISDDGKDQVLWNTTAEQLADRIEEPDRTAAVSILWLVGMSAVTEYGSHAIRHAVLI